MYAPERHRAIVDRVATGGRASVNDLADLLEVTPETIRRDLTELEKQGLVRRVHGGAIPVRRLGFQPTVDSRNNVRVEEKARIAQAALEEVPLEGAIIVDSGTTTGRLVAMLPHDRQLTVVTNSVQHAIALANRENITVLLLGGRVRGRTLACVDSWAIQSLKGITADVAFVGADGISVDRGLTTPDRTEGEIKAAMLAAARRTVVLADCTKFGDEHFANFGRVEDIDVIITDRGLEADVAQEIEAAGPMVVRA